MGYYIQTGTLHGKARAIAEAHNGEIVSAPKQWSDIPADKALVCVVDNGPFEAAGVCVDEQEFESFVLTPDSGRQRPRDYVLLDRAKAFELSRFRPRESRSEAE